MDMRELKGLEIAARCRIEFKDGAWLVPSQSSGAKYRVRLKPQESCECEDFQLRQQPCKHVHAARLVLERDYGGKAPALDTDTVPKRPTYPQNWPAYNQAQQTEKKRFQQLLCELCKGLNDPPQPKTGRRWKPMADIAFACAFKVYSTFSTRRFQCDLDDACEKGYLSQPMHGMAICHYLESDFLTPVLHGLIVRSSLPLKGVETTFAPNSTGFSTSRFVKWYDEKYGMTRSGKQWVKAHVICGVKTNVITSVIIEGKDTGDAPQFKPLVEATAASGFTVQEVAADKAYLSHENLAVAADVGGTAYIPFKSNSVQGEPGSLWAKTFGYYQFRRDEFLKHYHQRSNIESTFSMVKAKFRDHVRSKTDTAMKNEVLCKLLCHNICVVIQSQCELGIEATFWPEEEGGPRNIIPMSKPAL